MLFVLIILAACFIGILIPVKAEFQTFIVPENYPTISAAIKNANDGDIIFVKAGVYQEKTLEINKSFSLIGDGPESTTIDLSPELKVSFPPDLPPELRKLETAYYFEPSIKVNANGFRLEGFTLFGAFRRSRKL